MKLEVLGHTGQGREIIAVKLTQGAKERTGRQRVAAVLYSSTQHAREWIAAEVNRRLMNHYIDRWRANDRAVRKMLQTTELWFILVANPDGYQYTFDHERLWRKNLRDNNGDGQTQVGDGVDPNRNFRNHWGYDEEGSSSIQSSDTYRGPAPKSEPETQAMVGLLDRIGFAFQVNWHSAGQWLLYAEGWQTSTPTADDPIYYAMSGNLDDPAIDEFHPGLSSDVLYVTNGETTDYAHAATGALAWTPELSEGCDGLRLRLPRRRRAGAGRVRARPAVRQLGGRLGGRPRRPEDGHRDRDQAVLRRQRRPVQAQQPGHPAELRQVVRRPAASRRDRQAQPRRRGSEVPHRRRRGAVGTHVRVGGRVDGTTRRRSTTTSCEAW